MAFFLFISPEIRLFMNQSMRAKLHTLLFNNMLQLSPRERWRSSAGALLAVGLCGLILHALTPNTHWLIAPIGASIVILFVQSHSPLAQPWSVIGSYMVATVIGLLCAYWIAVPQIAAAVSVALTVWMMVRINCVHPPSGALALLLVLDGPSTPAQMAQTSGLVALNVAFLLLAAVLINNVVLGRRYPYTLKPSGDGVHKTRDPSPIRRTGLNHADLESAVKKLNTFVDIQEEEMLDLYNLAVANAFERHMGLTCGDVMSRDVVTVKFDTPLEDAWNQLRFHKIKALPVVDHFNRMIGIVTVADYLRQIDETSAAGLAVRLQGLLRRTPGRSSEKAEVVGQIMTANVDCARPETPIADLVHQMTEKSQPHVPVVDDQNQVVGIVTQSDALAALYRRVALSAS